MGIRALANLAEHFIDHAAMGIGPPPKTAQLIRVGQGVGYNYSTVQAALDAVVAAGDAAADNMYGISVAPGLYAEKVTHNASHTVVYGEVPHAAVIQTKSGGATFGGTYSIGTDTAGLAENIWVCGLTINNQWEGDIGHGNPPEGALYISGEEVWDTDLNWDMIHVIGNEIIGVHDGLQIFGTDIGATGKPGRLFVRGNTIKCAHDAYTLKGNARVMSSSNQIYTLTEGDIDLLPTAADWKSTGFHFRADPGSGVVSAHSFFDSVGDQLWMDIRGDIGAASTQQDRVAGVLCYFPGTNDQIPISFTGLRMRIDYDNNYTPTKGGVACVAVEGNTVNAPTFDGLSARLHQRNTGASAPAVVYGFNSWDTVGVSSKVVFNNSRFSFTNDKAAGTSTLFNAPANCTVEYNNVVHDGTTFSSGAGVFTDLGAVKREALGTAPSFVTYRVLPGPPDELFVSMQQTGGAWVWVSIIAAP